MHTIRWWLAGAGLALLALLIAFVVGRLSGAGGEGRSSRLSPLGETAAELAAEQAAAERDALRAWVSEQLDALRAEIPAAPGGAAAGGDDRLRALERRLKGVSGLESRLAALDKLEARLTALESRAPAAAGGGRADPALTERLKELEVRLGELEARRPSLPAAAAPGAGDAASGFEALQQRVYEVELRQEREERARVDTSGDLLKRMNQLEKRSDEAVGRSDADLASMLQRLENAEARIESLER